MNRTIIDIHALQTLPPSNINRDDTGSPKTATYGGVTRARVSSQAWKRAIRKKFEDTLDKSDLGKRTKQIVETLAERIAAKNTDLSDTAQALAVEAFKAVGLKIEVKKAKKDEEPTAPEIGYLMFLSNQQYDRLAEAIIATETAGEKLDKKALKAIVNSDHSIDMALFGRMVADVSDLNVDAACQVAHAISVHGVNNEFDYYTAVDDAKEDEREVGAGMIGTIEFNSSTLYRYATIDVDRLHDNLGDDAATVRAVTAFVKSFITSMPTGKQNTFANRTVPDAVVVNLRDTQPVSYAGAFEVPVTAEDKASRVTKATESLARYATDLDVTYDDLKPVATWTMHVGDGTAAVAQLGETVPHSELMAKLEAAVSERVNRS